MKKLILIIGILGIVGCSEVGGDNDKLCQTKGLINDAERYITENCEPNDILVLKTDVSLISYWTSRWCRFDREIVVAGGKSVGLTCVLNDITRRKGI